ncbi:HAD family phosphatase [Nocardioides seonyuensis]|uniref:HAD family phosphatase n=1 Tax=Nocardioides seonyuensis TaxID=2518371 RepID=A0A4P7ID10_9ACTN|nr:HAD family hydrolase [Nocardioides seonyuensis]QBX54530.1 HAD family phosphatase [Nocardioides seonyuensis]
MRIRLVVTDLDGTLLRDDLSVSPRTRAALDGVRKAGVRVVPVTARQPIGVRHIAEDAGFEDWAICSNGSLGVHLGTGEQLWETHLAVQAQQALVKALVTAVPGVLCASVRDGGDKFVAQEGYSSIATYDDHKRDVTTMGNHPVADVLAEPSLKLILRHPEIGAEDLRLRLDELGLGGFSVTSSGAPFLEVMSEGITKAWGVARLCSLLGIEPREVMAFGDALNDVEMLTWAGRGVAVANAHPGTRAVADEVTASNMDDGVAQALELLVEQQGH